MVSRGGILACAGDCSYDTSGCTAPTGCGDGSIDAGEECDGTNLGAATCIGQGFDGGTLTCSASCLLDTTACHECGNGIIEAVEECDGADLGAASCTTLGLGFTGGTLACSGACTFDVGACTTCGDGVAEAGEQCDGSDLAGNTCTTAGAFEEGTLLCTGACTFDTAMCIACGDGVAEGMENCDGTDLGGASCTSIGQGFIGGTLACAGATCTYDTSACTLPPNCPNGTINAGEDCDPPAMGAGTCSSETGGGLPSGALTCSAACAYDATGCYACGNSTVEGVEACDGSAFAGETCVSLGHDGGMLACAAGCLTIVETSCTDCGDAVAEGAEPCDGADLGGESCITVGAFSGGTLACNATCSGFVTSGCFGPPTVPQLRKPINATYMGSMFVTGSRIPTFTWETSTVMGGAGISYDLQYTTDPTFVLGVTTVPTPFLSHTPAADLPTSSTAPVGGRYWWRVRACAGSACSAYSMAWYLNVGRSDHDFNGDGYADVLVGAYSNDAGGIDAGSVYLYLGGAGGTFNSTADATLTGAAAGDAFGYTVASAGDVNGDGFADVVVGAYLNDFSAMNAGRAYVYLGSSGTFDTAPDGTMSGTGTNGWYGYSVATAGDMNGDGYDDVLVGCQAGPVYVFNGGAGSSFDSTSDGTLSGVGAELFGFSIDGAGDVNGDGYADVVVGAPFNDVVGTDAGRTYIFLGGMIFNGMSDGILPGAAAGDGFGYSVSSAGDVNDDGFADMIAGAPNNDTPGIDAGRAYVFFGSSGVSFDVGVDGTLSGAAAGDNFGFDVAGAGSVNGDAFADVIVGARLNDSAAPNAGRAYVYFGSAAASLDAGVDGTLTGATMSDEFGGSVAGAGDLNGDLYSDLVVGAHLNDFAGANAGRAYVYLGAATFSATVDGTLTGAAAGDLFGRSVACLGGSSARQAGTVLGVSAVAVGRRNWRARRRH